MKIWCSFTIKPSDTRRPDHYYKLASESKPEAGRHLGSELSAERTGCPFFYFSFVSYDYSIQTMDCIRFSPPGTDSA